MKMKKSVKFAKKYLKINISTIKKYHTVRNQWYHTEEYRGAAHNICNLKHSVLKKISITFHNGSNYGYHFVIKELAEEFRKITYLFRRKHGKKNRTFTVPIKKEVARISENGKEIIKNVSCNLLIAQDLWQDHYLILLITFLKEFIELNVNSNIAKKCAIKRIELELNVECRI